MRVYRIMALVDPTLTRQVAFERAVQLAQATGADLHVYACAELQGDGPFNVEAERVLLQPLERLVVELLASAREKGISSTSEIDASSDWRSAAVAAAARCSANLLIKYCFDHSELQRQLRITSDWLLLRNAPCPVLLARNQARWQHRRILAAVNINVGDGAHVWLNNQIVSVARGLAEATGSEVHFVNAFRSNYERPNADELALRCGVPLQQVHVKAGAAADVIAGLVEVIGVDLVVMGTVGRSGIRGKLFGNTSEELMDIIHADMLVVN
jgi:universal stress protein E